jgi:hypothetical protein
MYQSLETDSATIKEAKESGHSGRTDYGEDVKKSFQKNTIRRRFV